MGRDLGLLEKIKAPFANLFGIQAPQATSAYKTMTEYSPAFSPWEGSLYQQVQTRAIVERIATACSKLKPEFVTPEGSGGAVPRIQRLFGAAPNDMMGWPDFLRRVATLLYVDTTAYVVPGYDGDGNIVSLWPLKPNHTELVEFEGEPWLRFVLPTGETWAFPFYHVAILTRFQLDSDIFGGGNRPLTPTLRLMEAQRQAEEIALQTGADIRFIGKLTGLVHERDMEAKRDRFAKSNLGPQNTSSLMVYDQTWDEVKQITPEHFTIDPDEMARIDKALYAYFGINEKILNNTYNEQEWAAFYEGVVEAFGILLASRLNMVLLTPTQIRKGNHVMFSSGYLEYATPETKLKVVSNMMDRGIYTVNESRDVFQLPHIPGGNVRMIRGEYYMIDDHNNIVAESGGKTDHSVNDDNDGWWEDDDLSDLDEPDVSIDTGEQK